MTYEMSCREKDMSAPFGTFLLHPAAITSHQEAFITEIYIATEVDVLKVDTRQPTQAGPGAPQMGIMGRKWPAVASCLYARVSGYKKKGRKTPVPLFHG